jgi:cell division septation protein DedD
MRNNETGEFELVVGNHQLLSGFFIVVLLFAVAFAMGYVVGQNSPRSAKVQAEASQAAGTAAQSDSRPQPAGPVPVSQPSTEPPAQDPTATGAADPDGQPQPTTQPAREPQAAASAIPPAPPPPSSTQSPAANLSNGSFWQVMAVAQADADLIAKTLKDKGFPVVLSRGPNNLVRVLVGPYTDVQAMGKAKVDLESAGFLHPFRYQRDR